MNSTTRASLYLTPPQPCAYLDDRQSRSLILDPRLESDGLLFSRLSSSGFRRSGTLIYRPHCDNCRACIPVRIPVEQFVASRQQQRTLKRGQTLSVRQVDPALTDEYYELYSYYIEQRHADGSMYPPSREQFVDFLAQPLPYARFYEFRRDGRLLAVAVSDLLSDGLSAVYSFYDPDDRYHSLGRLCVLWQINEARRLGLPYLYLGYWIQGSPKMSYKTDYQPLEVFHQDSWLDLASVSKNPDFQFAVSAEIPL